MSALDQLGPGRLRLGSFDALRRKPGASLLGLSLDGAQLEGVWVRRINGSVEVRKAFSVVLAEDPLVTAPEVAGREIRKHLDAAGVRERRCVVCLPLSWALTLLVKLPDLPPAELDSLLDVEAERGFPHAPEALLMARSHFQGPTGERYATLMAVLREPVKRLEAVLEAAQVRVTSVSLGIAALQEPPAQPTEGVLALAPRARGLDLLVGAGGGVVTLRALEGAYEEEGDTVRLQPETLVRELRISLGQLPPDIRDTLRAVRIFGEGSRADELAETLRPWAATAGLRLERVAQYQPGDFAVALPQKTAVSAALSLAVRRLTGRGARFEFLPPRQTAWQKLSTRYSSRKLAWAGAGAAVLVLGVAMAFLVQQVQLWHWNSRWQQMAGRVAELEELQQRIKRYRPWFDDSVRSLSILRRLTEAFPEDGTVSAKSVEIREPATVTCTGTARDSEALLRMLEKLRRAREVSDVKVEQMRGKSPIEFSFNFQWSLGGGS